MKIIIYINLDYVIIARKDKKPNSIEFIKINDKDIINPLLTFDEDGNVLIPKSKEEIIEEQRIFDDFIQHLLTSPMERKEYEIDYLGKKMTIDDLTLSQYFFEVLFTEKRKKSEIEEVIVILPDEYNQEEVKKRIGGMMKQLNVKNIIFIDERMMYDVYISNMLNEEMKKIQTKKKKVNNGIIIVENNKNGFKIIDGFLSKDHRKKLNLTKTQTILMDETERNDKKKEDEVITSIKKSMMKLQEGTILLVDKEEQKEHVSFVQPKLMNKMNKNEKMKWSFKDIGDINKIHMGGCSMIIEKNDFNSNGNDIDVIQLTEFEENQPFKEMIKRKQVFDGIPMVKEWLETVKEEYKEMEDYHELVRIMKEIVDEKD